MEKKPRQDRLVFFRYLVGWGHIEAVLNEKEPTEEEDVPPQASQVTWI